VVAGSVANAQRSSRASSVIMALVIDHYLASRRAAAEGILDELLQQADASLGGAEDVASRAPIVTKR